MNAGQPGAGAPRGDSGFQSVFLVLLILGVVLALGLVGFVLWQTSTPPASIPPLSVEPRPDEKTEEPVQMPSRIRGEREVAEDALAATEEDPPQMGPIPGWTLEASQQSVEEAIQALSTFSPDADPYEIEVAVQKLAEQKDFAIPAIQAALAELENTSFGNKVSIVEDLMKIFPNVRTALMESLRRIDTEASGAVLASLLANAQEPLEAGYAIWMLENSSAPEHLVQESLRSASEHLLGSGFAGAGTFRDLLSTRWILDAVKRNPHPEALSGLVRLSRESDNQLVRREAEQALAASGHPQAIETLLDLYDAQEEPSRKNEKARLIGQTHGLNVIPSLRDRLFDSNRPESERSAMVAGIAAYNSVTNREDRLRRLLSEGRTDAFDRAADSYRADLEGRLEVLDQLIESIGTKNSLGTHAEIARRRLTAMQTRLEEMSSQ